METPRSEDSEDLSVAPKQKFGRLDHTFHMHKKFTNADRGNPYSMRTKKIRFKGYEGAYSHGEGCVANKASQMCIQLLAGHRDKRCEKKVGETPIC